MLKPIKIHLEGFSFLMIPIEGGIFNMGDEIGDLVPITWSLPAHTQEVDSFYLAQCPTTQQFWKLIMGEYSMNLRFKGKERPMAMISWYDVQEFLFRLALKSKKKFRLPSEAEWEFAARGGRLNSGNLYSGSSQLKEVGWYNMNSHSETKPVGRKMPNELGLFDMSGNVFEWCSNDFIRNNENQPDSNANSGNYSYTQMKINRGGGWGSIPNHCRSANCNGFSPQFQNMFLGFRIALSL